MDPGRLQVFLRIVELGSMSAAARAVHLTQPALSRGMKQLEEEVGVELFERRGRGLVLTPAGRALVPRARALLAAAERARLEVGRSARRGYFDLRLGTVDSVATFLVPRIVEPLRAALPGLVIKFSTARTSLLLQRVRNGELDLAVVAHSGPPPDVASERIGAYALQYHGLAARYPGLAAVRTEAELRELPVVEIEPAPGSGALVPDESLSYAVASNVATVKALVLAGFGVGELPDFMLTRDERSLLVHARIPHDPDCALFLARAPDWTGATESQVSTLIVKTLRHILSERRAARA